MGRRGPLASRQLEQLVLSVKQFLLFSSLWCPAADGPFPVLSPTATKNGKPRGTQAAKRYWILLPYKSETESFKIAEFFFLGEGGVTDDDRTVPFLTLGEGERLNWDSKSAETKCFTLQKPAVPLPFYPRVAKLLRSRVTLGF